MDRKKLIWLGIFLGSTVGGFIPVLWGDSMVSMSGIVFSGLGAFAGIYLGFKLGE
ncbi:MAG: hypothetical protein ABL899_00820 [Nitrospira sp.]